MARKAGLRESLEQETCLWILPLCIAFCRIVSAPGQSAAQKPEALRYLLAMGFELLSVLSQGMERGLYALAMLWRLKLLCVETPGEDTGQRLEECVHGGMDTMLGGSVLGDGSSLEAKRQDDEQRCQSYRVLPCVHRLSLLS